MQFSTAIATAIIAAASAFAAPPSLKPLRPECKPSSLLETFITARNNETVYDKIIGPKMTYVSLNYDSPGLQELIPWTGTHYQGGPKEIFNAFDGAGSLWNEIEFKAFSLFGDDINAAAFGNLTYTAKWRGAEVKSLFSIYINATDCKIQYLTLQMDTFALSEAWVEEGAIKYHPHPEPYPYDPNLVEYPNVTSVILPKGKKVCSA